MNRAKSYPRRWNYGAVAVRPRIARRHSLAWGKVGITALFLVLLGFLGFLFLDDSFYVFSPKVQGNLVMPSEAVIAASGIQGYHIFFIDPQEVAMRVVALPDIALAKVRIALPDQAIIEVQERKPHLLWQAGEEVYPLDATGAVLSPQAVEATITIHDLEGQPLKPGERVDRQILRAAEAYQALDPKLAQLDYASQTGLSFLTAAGTRVILGMEERAEQKLAMWRALEEHLRDKGVFPAVIDLRFDPPYFRPGGE